MLAAVELFDHKTRMKLPDVFEHLIKIIGSKHRTAIDRDEFMVILDQSIDESGCGTSKILRDAKDL